MDHVAMAKSTRYTHISDTEEILKYDDSDREVRC